MKRNKIDFLIFYEVKTREFESIVLLRNALVARGYSCDYISFSQIYDKKLKKRFRGNVKVAVVPSLYDDSEIKSIVYRVAGKVDYIVNLRWEQVFTIPTEKDPLNYVFPKGSAKNAIHCCWGDEPRNMLLRAGVPEENAVITGPMHMDVLAPAFQNYFLPKDELFEKYGIPVARPCILFISSYVLATYTEREVESYLRAVGEDKREGIKRKLERDRLSHGLTVEWLKHVAKKWNVSVVYRPHPSEHMSSWEQADKAEGIYTTGDYNVKQWIKCCDIVLTWISTSIVEAFFSDVSCAILRPVEIPVENEMSVYAGTRYIRSEEEFDNYVREVLAKKESGLTSGVNGEIIKKYYDVQEKASFDRTADLLVRLKSDYNCFDWNQLHIRPVLFSIKEGVSGVIRAVYRGMLRIVNKSFLMKVKLFSGLRARAHNLQVVMKKEKENTISEQEFRNMEELLKR